MTRWFTREERVSPQWLREQAQKGSRIEFEGIVWRWPRHPIKDEAGWRNRQEELKRA